MPLISLFYGIRVTMDYDDNNPPHFHAEYNGYSALIEISKARVIKGNLPSRQLKDKDIFTNTCTILNDTLAWDVGGNRDETSCIDIDPETLYMLDAIDERIA